MEATDWSNQGTGQCSADAILCASSRTPLLSPYSLLPRRHRFPGLYLQCDSPDSVQQSLLISLISLLSAVADKAKPESLGLVSYRFGLLG